MEGFKMSLEEIKDRISELKKLLRSTDEYKLKMSNPLKPEYGYCYLVFDFDGLTFNWEYIEDQVPNGITLASIYCKDTEPEEEKEDWE